MTNPFMGSCRGWSRRAILAGAAAALGTMWWGTRHRNVVPVFIARNQRYDGALEQVLENGLESVGIALSSMRGRTILLKPNLVEPSRASSWTTTHPAVVVAAAEVFRRHGARVVVGEGPGHLRDTELALFESGVGDALVQVDMPFADLNYEESVSLANRGHLSPLDHFFLPKSVLTADLVVSLPKLKTHHWVGMTAAMKNMYGILPGVRYGWPKNVLHYAGIPQTVVDLCATVPSVIAIVDAIECMQGDGPITGSRKQLGMLVLGANLAAVDATCARVMGLAPSRIEYLKLAASSLGPIAEAQIQQRGEAWRSVRSPFLLPAFEHLRDLQSEE